MLYHIANQAILDGKDPVPRLMNYRRELRGSDYQMVACGPELARVLGGIVVNRKSSLSPYRIVTVLGDVSYNNPPIHGVYNPTVDNALASVVERVFLVKENGLWVPPLGDRVNPQVFGAGQIALLATHLVSATPDVLVLSREQFVDGYVGPLKKRYEQANDVMNFRGLRRSDCLVRMFLKDEKQEVPRPGQPGKAPRAIRPMSPEFNLELGRYVKPLEKALYVGLNRVFGSGTVAKGMNSGQVANTIVEKWLRVQSLYGQPVSVSTDMSRFDQHVSIPALVFVRNICRRVLRRSGVPESSVRYFTKLWNMTLRTENIVLLRDGKIRFQRAGTLCSGVMYTSLCGVVLTCLVLGSCAKELRIRGFSMISAGDDTNPIMPRDRLVEFVERLPGHCARYGFSVKVESVEMHNVGAIEFCRSKPLYVDGSWIMCRNLHTCLERDLITCRIDQGERNWMKRLGAIAACGLSTHGGVPVFQSFYSMMKRASSGLVGTLDERNSGFFRSSVGMSRSFGSISVGTRVRFYESWGVTVSDQLRLEDAFDRVILAYGGPTVKEIFYDTFFRSLFRTHA